MALHQARAPKDKKQDVKQNTSSRQDDELQHASPDLQTLDRKTILHLQSTIGNRAVQRLLATKQQGASRSRPIRNVQRQVAVRDVNEDNQLEGKEASAFEPSLNDLAPPPADSNTESPTFAPVESVNPIYQPVEADETQSPAIQTTTIIASPLPASAIQTKVKTPSIQRGFWDSVSNAASSVGNAIGNAASSAGSAVGSAVGSAGNAVGEAAGAVGGAVSNAVSGVGGAIGGAVNTVGGAVNRGKEWVFNNALRLAGVPKNAVMSLIGRAGSAMFRIVENPIGFVSSLISSIKQGFTQFGGNIARHLKKGLFGWLFGTLENAGISLPERFDLKGVFSTVFQVVGLTVEKLKGRLARMLGEQNAGMLAKAYEYITSFMKGGLTGLWSRLTGVLTNLKTAIFEPVRNWVVTNILQGGIRKILDRFNPVSALVSAIQTIYRVVMFFKNQAGRIASLLQAVLGSAKQIATGAIGTVAGRIEQALGRAIPLVINFLSRFLGLGGIADKIRNLIMRVRAPIEQVINRVLQWIVSKVRRLIAHRQGNTQSATASRKAEQVKQ